jgi:NAD(P)-dependent dehydrogenase (short-subunit alcohol dehydrogenase family)
VIDVNLVGPFLTCRAVVPHLLANGYCRIVNVASIAGKEGNPTSSHYSASRQALIGLTEIAGKELATKNILVNASRRGRQHRDLCADETGAHRVATLRSRWDGSSKSARDCRARLLGWPPRLLLLHRRGLRHQWRAEATC